jgi:ATP adenylyltransferase
MGVHAFVILNKYPYNNGHFMVAPYRHISDFGALTPEEGTEIFTLMQLGSAILKAQMHPDGFNMGMNVGKVAGAGVEEHLHFHVVPRWNGDTNFMPVLGDTKVISEHLEQTYDVLFQGFKTTDN